MYSRTPSFVWALGVVLTVLVFVFGIMPVPAHSAPPTTATSAQAGDAPTAAPAASANKVVPEFQDDWFYDQNAAFRGIVGLIHRTPAPAASEAPGLRTQCASLVVDYNKKAALHHAGLFKRRQLPTRLDASECK